MKSVLFVDDEQSILNAIGRMYLERDDVHCHFATSHAEALNILRSENIRVVVSDCQAPGTRCIEFLARVREIRPDAVRILMTAYADIAVAIDAINKSDAFRFVTKPWNNSELMATIDEALMRYKLAKSLESEDESLFLSLAQEVELKDSYTDGHCDRVARYAVALARSAGLDEQCINDIRHGSWLHDCGKIGVPEGLLNSPGQLSEVELDTVQQHSRWGSEVARQARMPDTVINIILYHHERIDGKGYPAGLNGEYIPLEARIVAIADVFDVLYSDRPYRKAFGFDQSIEILLEMTDSHFDRTLIELFLPIAEEVRTNG